MGKGDRWQAANDFVNGFIVLTFLLLAEYAALRPLTTGDAKDGYPALVVGGLVVGFLAIAVISLLPLRGSSRA